MVRGSGYSVSDLALFEFRYSEDRKCWLFAAVVGSGAEKASDTVRFGAGDVVTLPLLPPGCLSN